MMPRWYSLRRRLLALLLGGVAACWLVTLAFSYYDAHHEIDELFDAQLAQVGQSLLALAGRGSSGVGELGDIAHPYQRQLRFQIWRADGRLLMHSENAAGAPLTSRTGYSETEGANGHWRHFSQWNADHSLQVQVSEHHKIRDELIANIAWRLLLPALFGLPLLGLWIWVVTRKSMHSLNEVAAQIGKRAPEQLQAVLPEHAPQEIRPMLEALNDLFVRVEMAMENERQFTADAAHELRTPLAALQAQLQVAMRARNSGERDHSLQQLQLGLARAAHLVEQMLQLARLDPENRLPSPEPVNMAELAAEVCADLGAWIDEKQLDFALEAEPLAALRGQREWLRVMLRNLIDNAIRYSPSGSRLRVRVAPHGGGGVVEVLDSGPGIPPMERSNVLQRFRRLGASESGSGLGLPIAARIAELHGLELRLASTANEQGLSVQISWPASGIMA